MSRPALHVEHGRHVAKQDPGRTDHDQQAEDAQSVRAGAERVTTDEGDELGGERPQHQCDSDGARRKQPPAGRKEAAEAGRINMGAAGEDRADQPDEQHRESEAGIVDLGRHTIETDRLGRSPQRQQHRVRASVDQGEHVHTGERYRAAKQIAPDDGLETQPKAIDPPRDRTRPRQAWLQKPEPARARSRPPVPRSRRAARRSQGAPAHRRPRPARSRLAGGVAESSRTMSDGRRNRRSRSFRPGCRFVLRGSNGNHHAIRAPTAMAADDRVSRRANALPRILGWSASARANSRTTMVSSPKPLSSMAKLRKAIAVRKYPNCSGPSARVSTAIVANEISMLATRPAPKSAMLEVSDRTRVMGATSGSRIPIPQQEASKRWTRDTTQVGTAAAPFWVDHRRDVAATASRSHARAAYDTLTPSRDAALSLLPSSNLKPTVEAAETS